MKQIIIFLSLILGLFAREGGFDEAYYELDIKQKRIVFIEKIGFLLDESFKKVLAEREFVSQILKEAKNEQDLSAQNLEKLKDLQQKYRVKELFALDEYLIKINITPKSLGIAQAIVESATGTSRFAREANNLFGEWTWGEKGLVPSKRESGKTHKIRIFDNLQESVDSYVLNLNRHYAYENFRNLRVEFAKNGEKFTGLKAAEAMNNYSEIKNDYTILVQKLIKQYDLEKLD